MKKRIFTMLLIVLIVAVCSSVLAPVAAEDKAATATEKEIVMGALDARFLNMLNHNYVYNEGFDCADDMINDSVMALLDLRDKENADFIAEKYVKGFVYDMYGLQVADMSALNEGFPSKEGYVYVIPRGMVGYEHSILSVDENEDGSFTVVTEVTVDSHDSEDETFKAVSLFVKNEASAFGYNIVYCNIAENASDI